MGRTYQSRAQIMYPDSRYINTINHDSTTDWINLRRQALETKEALTREPTNLRMLIASVDFPLPVRKEKESKD